MRRVSHFSGAETRPILVGVFWPCLPKGFFPSCWLYLEDTTGFCCRWWMKTGHCRHISITINEVSVYQLWMSLQ